MANRSIRPIRIEGNVAYVPLTKGYEAIIDVSDVPLVEGRNWTALVKSNTVYAYRRIKSSGCTNVRMHRLLLDCPRHLEVDHINGNGLDNRRINLRLATCAQNRKNVRPHKKSASGLKGAAYHTQTGRWLARIKCDGKTHYLGIFQTAQQAHEAYCKASVELHGEFARLS